MVDENPSGIPSGLSRRQFFGAAAPAVAAAVELLRRDVHATAAEPPRLEREERAEEPQNAMEMDEDKEIKEGADVTIATHYPAVVFWEKGDDSGRLEKAGEIPDGKVKLSVGPLHNGEYDQVIVNYKINGKDSGPKDGKYEVELKKDDKIEVTVLKVMPPAHAEFGPVKSGEKGHVLVSIIRPLAGKEKDKDGDLERWRSSSMIIMDAGLQAGADKTKADEVMEKGIKIMARKLAQYALTRVEGNETAGRFRDMQLAVLLENAGDGKIAQRQAGLTEDELAEAIELAIISIKRKTLTGGTSLSEELQSALKMLNE